MYFAYCTYIHQMKTSLLFDKKFASIFPGANSKIKFERKYYYEVLIKGCCSSSPGPSPRLFLNDIPKLISLCDDGDIHLIGFETDIDSCCVPFFVRCFEEYGPSGIDNTWVWYCLEEMKGARVTQDIIGYIDLSNEQYEIFSQVYDF
jgi:hypothetical protein